MRKPRPRPARQRQSKPAGPSRTVPPKVVTATPTQFVRRQRAEPAAYAKIRSNPKFQELIRQRNRLAGILSLAMLAIYFGFILLVAFGSSLLGTPLGGGMVMTVGIPIGLFVIVSAFVLTGIYVSKANTTFDDLNAQVLSEAK